MESNCVIAVIETTLKQLYVFWAERNLTQNIWILTQFLEGLKKKFICASLANSVVD